MVENLENIDLAVLALLLNEEEKTKNTKLWVHDVWKKRKTKGEFATLYKGLVDHGTFFEYYFLH
jgi:hypothetical protein